MAKYERAAKREFGPHHCQPEYLWYDDSTDPFSDIEKRLHFQAAAWAEVGGCRIWIDYPHWRSQTRESRCGIFVHEYLHLLGYDHGTRAERRVWGRFERRFPRACRRFRS